MDVADSDHLNESHEVYRSVLVDLNTKGFSSTEHTPAITPENMARFMMLVTSCLQQQRQ